MLLANIYPNRITVSNKRTRTHSQLVDSWLNRYHKDHSAKKDGTSEKNFAHKKTSLSLSANSIRNLRNSVNSLIFLSKPRTVFSPSKKPIYNFRGAFITLTLPSSQAHTDTELKQCLDLFLQDLRRVYKVQNYVWRSELQANGNIHFHLLIDQYIYHQVIRNYWLKALRNTGYVQEYQKKFLKMSFLDYKRLRLLSAKMRALPIAQSHAKIVKAYAHGTRTKWLSPNCTDVKNIYNVNQMSAYISKYMAKETKKRPADVEYTPDYVPSKERIASFGKVWGRSTSLSALKYIFPLVLESVQPFIDALIDTGSVFTKIYEWSTIYYFNFKEMPRELYARIHSNIFSVARTWNYPLTN